MNTTAIKEALNNYGPAELTNAEHIALITRTDTTTAAAIIQRAGGFSNLLQMTAAQLKSIATPAQAAALTSLTAIVERARRQSPQLHEKITDPESAANYLKPLLQHEPVEHFITIFLNTKNKVTAHEIISIGNLNSAIVHPREVFNRAIAHRASAIIIGHNHPSGDANPSPEDIEMTKRLQEAGKIIGIDVLDHIIIGANTGMWISLSQGGLM